jgi:hypothetical protein
MKRAFSLVLPILLFLSAASATVHLVSPLDATFDIYKAIDIKPVGPGHNLILKFDRTTEKDYYWDNVTIKNQIDADWGTSAKIDSRYLYFTIHVPKTKQAGKYTFVLQLYNKDALIYSDNIEIAVGVTHDQNDLIQVTPFEKDYEFFADRDYNVTFYIKNLALSEATYVMTARMPDFPLFEKMVVEHTIAPNAYQAIPIVINAPEEGYYQLQVIITSEENPNIYQQTSTTLIVKPTLSSKFKSISRGFPIIPITMSPFYSLLGLLGF